AAGDQPRAVLAQSSPVRPGARPKPAPSPERTPSPDTVPRTDPGSSATHLGSSTPRSEAGVAPSHIEHGLAPADPWAAASVRASHPVRFDDQQPRVPARVQNAAPPTPTPAAQQPQRTSDHAEQSTGQRGRSAPLTAGHLDAQLGRQPDLAGAPAPSR